MTSGWSVIGVAESLAAHLEQEITIGLAAVKASMTPTTVTEALLDFASWCDEQGAKLGAVDGYGYHSGEEAAYRHASIEATKRALASLSLPPPGEGASTELINRLQDAVEGECEGLAIDEDQARAILEHVGYLSTPAELPSAIHEAIQLAVDYLKETKQGSPARSAGHNARLVLEAALAASPQQGEKA